MSGAHTPGPWEQSTFKAANGDVCPGVKSAAASIAVAWTHGRTEAEAVGNARLMAAAPNMAAALQRAAHVLAELSDQSPELKTLRSQIVAAIILATPEHYRVHK